MPRNNPPLGLVDGDRCNRVRLSRSGMVCDGVIMLHPPENCSCHISAPCSSCTAPRFYCPECGWEEADEIADHQRRSVQGMRRSSLSNQTYTEIDRRLTEQFNILNSPALKKEIDKVFDKNKFKGHCEYSKELGFKYIEYKD